MANVNLHPGVRNPSIDGIRISRIVTYTGPTSYATGGDPFTAGEFGLGTIECFPSSGILAWSGSAVRLVIPDYVNSKLVWYVPNTGAEVAAATNLSTFTARVEVRGK